MKTRKEELQAILERWRVNNPSCRAWSDAEVLEAIMLRLTVTHPQFVTVKKGLDGVNIFTTKPK